MDWPTYAGNWDASKYKPLDQINASNFNKLEIVWRFKTDHIGNRPEFKLEGTPLEVGGVVYTRPPVRAAGSSRSMPSPANCSGCMESMKVRAAPRHPGNCPAAACPTGATAPMRASCT